MKNKPTQAQNRAAAELLRTQRRGKGLTQEQVARRAGIHFRVYGSFECCERNFLTARFRTVHVNDCNIYNCAHCEHGLTEESRYKVGATNGDVWRTFGNPSGEGRPTNKGSDICEHWQRAADHTIWREACDIP